MRFVKMTVLAVICLLLSAFSARAGTFNAESFTLDNGMRVVVIPNHRAPVVTHMVWYVFGAADEKPGVSGVAHFLEHLMFKGTPTVPDGQFSSTVKKLGGNDNAFTSQDYTAYYQNIAKKHLPVVMEMEADRMKNLTLEEDEVASERQVIIEERHQRVDNQPQSLFQEQLSAALSVNHPYATPVIGWMHEIEKLTREDALDSYRRWYAPNNAILVVSGDITAQELKPLAEKYYGPLAPSAAIPAQRLRPRPAPLRADNRLTLRDSRVGIPAFVKLWRAPRNNDALDILAEIVGGSSTSRLYKKLVMGKKIAVSVNVGYDPISLDDTSFSIYASPAPGVSMEKLEAAIVEEIALLQKGGVTEEELGNAKKRKTASFIWYLDSLQGPAMLFGRALTGGFDIAYLESWTERINALTLADVNAAARALLEDDDRPVTGLLLPEIQEGKKP